jgi:hypothetical protein
MQSKSPMAGDTSAMPVAAPKIQSVVIERKRNVLRTSTGTPA